MKKILCISLIAMAALVSGACNYNVIDTHYKFNYAYVTVCGNYNVNGEVESWTDYEDSDMVQVTIDGVTYYTHASNVTLIYDPNLE